MTVWNKIGDQYLYGIGESKENFIFVIERKFFFIGALGLTCCIVTILISYQKKIPNKYSIVYVVRNG